MKVFLCFCSLFLFSVVNNFGQETGQRIEMMDINSFKAINPESWRFQQYSFSSLIGNTGKANVEVPLYEVRIGRLTVPVKIVYNTRGVKVEEQSSYVGTGWELVATGRITRQIFGGLHDLAYSKGYASADPIEPYDIMGYQKRGSNYIYHENQIDVSPDLFTCSAPGVLSRFFFTKYPTVRFLDDKNLILKDYNVGSKISVGTGMKGDRSFGIDDYTKFIIVNDQAVEYTFGTYELGLESSSGANITTWFLSEMKDLVTGESINFEYIDIGELFYGETEVRHPGESSRTCGCYMDNGTGTRSRHYMRNVKRLKMISWRGGRVEFNYTGIRSDIRDEDKARDNALTSVVVYNSLNNKVKEFKLLHSNFISTKPTTNALDDFYYYRLRLDKIAEINLKNSEKLEYVFNYYPGSLPHKRSKEQDLWGYYNMNKATSLVPKLYFYPSLAKLVDRFDGTISNTSVNCFFPQRLQNSSLQFYLLDGADRSANADGQRIGMLKKIVLPTGGTKEFTYESNEILVRGENILGGGLRVSSEKLTSGVSESYTKTFSYSNGSVLSFPQMAHVCGNPYEITSNILSQQLSVGEYSFVRSFDIDPYEVSYERISEMQEGKGKIVYGYSSLRPELESVEAMIEDCESCGCDPSKLYDSKYFILPPRTKLSNSLGSVRYYSEQDLNNLVKEEYFDYQISSEVLLSENAKSAIGGMDFVSHNHVYSDYLTLKYQKVNLDNKLEIADGVARRFTYEYDTDRDLLRRVNEFASNGRSSYDERDFYQIKADDYYYLFDYENLDGVQGVVAEAVRGLLGANMINFPIERHHYENRSLVSGELKTFNLYNNNQSFVERNYDLQLGQPIDFHDSGALYFPRPPYFPIMGVYVKRNEILKYTNSGNPTDVLVKEGLRTSFLWGYADQFPVAEVINASSDRIAYTSFETEELDSWDFDLGLIRSGSNFARTGKKSLLLTLGNSFYSPVMPAGSYFLEFFARSSGSNSFLVNGTSQTTSSEYKFYRLKFTPSINTRVGFSLISGPVEFDEVRIYPVGSQMTSRTFEPLVGVTSTTDPNGLNTFFEYDGFGRLETVKDHDGNIVNHYKYHIKTKY
jgi:YD repeat-containing protein